MEWIDKRIMCFMRWCEHPIWDRLFQHFGFHVTWFILLTKMRIFTAILDLAAVCGPAWASAWILEACQRYHVRLKQQAGALSDALRAAREQGSMPAMWHDGKR